MHLNYPKDSNGVIIKDNLEQLKDIQANLSNHLLHAQTKYKKVANEHHLDSALEVPKFRVGDRVWLLCHNVKTIRPCNKLDFQCLGPFVISHQVNDVAFRLNLPSHMRLHPVFHV